ncbi:MAG: DUF1361 domain-containing protein [Acidimicrobiia bacterium]
MNPFGGAWGWMYWNLTLAAIPLVLSLVVFRRHARTGPGWWVGVAAFVVFLPNAPYVLTDVQHLRWDTFRADTAELVVRYGALLAFGMAAYVLAMWRCTRFLIARGVTTRGVVAVNAGVGASCSLGVYLGRVHRFNSWDLVRTPSSVLRAALDGLSSHLALAGMAAVFAAIVFSVLLGIPFLDAVAARVRRTSQ